MTLNFFNSDRWSKCSYSGSPSRGGAAPLEFASESRLEGQAAAWVADLVLRGDASSAEDAIGEDAPNGWTITDDMVRHVQTYIDIVRSYGTPRSETTVSLWNGLVTGRPDANIVDDPSGVLRVSEFKYGWKIVEPENNTQLILGALPFFDPARHKIITLEIIQPRPYHPAGPRRKWSITPKDLEDWNVWLYGRAIATLEPVPIATPGDHCNHCPKQNGCAALAANIYAAHEIITDRRTGRKLTAEELAAELTFLERSENLVSIKLEGVRAEANARARAGEFLPGYALEPTQSRRAFTVGMDVVATLTGIAAYKQVAKSPAEMEADGANPDIINALSKPVYTGHKLKAWNKTALKQIFGRR